MKSQFLLTQVQDLYASGLHESADVLAQNIICHGSPEPELLFLYGKILHSKKEYKRAAAYFERVLQQLTAKGDRVPAEMAAEAAFLHSRCMLKTDDLETAMRVMQSVPVPAMTIRMLLHMARISQLNNSPHRAAKYYTEILKRNPMALEAAVALTELGASHEGLLKVSSERIGGVLHHYLTENVAPAADNLPSTPMAKKAAARRDHDENRSQQTKRTPRRAPAATTPAQRSQPRKPTTRSSTQQRQQKQERPQRPATTPVKEKAPKKQEADPRVTMAKAEALHAKRFFELYITASSLTSSSRYSEALKLWMEIGKFYRKHVHVISRTALCCLQSGSVPNASMLFDAVRGFEPKFVHGMDAYATLLKAEGKLKELNDLAMKLTSLHSRRPEPLVVMAIYCDMRREREMALLFLDKAVAISKGMTLSPLSLAVRGDIQVTLGKPKEAILSYRQAYAIKKSMPVFKGLVRAFLETKQEHQALHTAKEACNDRPNSPVALTLLGLCYVRQTPGSASTRAAAKKCLDAALKLDPNSFDAAMAYVQLHISTGAYPDAMQILSEQMKKGNRKLDLIHVAMGDVQLKMKSYTEAMASFNTALTINPHCERAALGIGSIQKLLQRLEQHDESQDLMTDDEDDLGDLEDDDDGSYFLS